MCKKSENPSNIKVYLALRGFCGDIKIGGANDDTKFHFISVLPFNSKA